LTLTQKALLIGIILFIISTTIYAKTALALKWNYREEIVHIWLPREYQIVNKKSDTFLTLSEIKISDKISVSLDLEEFKKHFNEAKIALIKGGQLYYWTEKSNVTYVGVYDFAHDYEDLLECRFLEDDKILVVIDQSFPLVLGGIGIAVVCILSPVCIAARKDC